MAVIKAKSQKLVRFALPVMVRDQVVSQLVTRIGGDQFKGAKGDEVWFDMPGLKAKARDYEFRTRTAPIVMDDIQGGARISVRLNKHVYSATTLTDEHMTLDDIDFANEVVGPQAEAVAEDFDAKAVAGFRAAAVKHTLTIDPTDDPHLVAIESRRLMDSDKVAPRSGRVFLIGTDLEAAWLASDRLSKYESTGEQGTPALRDAIIGRLAGSPVVVSNALEPDEGYYFHRSALLLANVAPLVPRGVSAGSSLSRDGYALRHIVDYDPNYLRDRSIVSSFLGVNDFRDERNADGSWMWQEGDDEDLIEQLGITDLEDAGTRKNVRVLKFDASGFGSVLPAES